MEEMAAIHERDEMRCETQRAVNASHFVLSRNWRQDSLGGMRLRFLSGLRILLLLGCLTGWAAGIATAAQPVALEPDQVLTAADDGTSQGEETGAAVAIDGDTAVIGVPGDDGGRGSVFIYGWDGGQWLQLRVIKAPPFNGWQPGRFGQSLVLAEGQLSVGAPATSTSAGQNAGAVYCFQASGDWPLLEAVTSPVEHPFGQFGHSFAITDQGMIVAAGNTAYAFGRAAGIWQVEAELAPPEVFNDWPAIVNRTINGPPRPVEPLYDYANDVALSGNTALVGAPGHQSVYVFVRTGGVWRFQTRIGSPHPGPATVPAGPPPFLPSLQGGSPLPSYQAYDDFGCAVALLGETAIIGAQGAGEAGLHGAAYIYQRSGTAWAKQVEMTPNSPHSSFGRRVVLNGGRALIGSYHYARPNSAPTGSSRGAVYVYGGAGTFWQRSAIIDAPYERAGIFGDGIAVSGNRVITGDIGLPAPYLTTALENGTSYPIVDGGAAHVFLFDGASWVVQGTLAPRPSGLADSSEFGSVLAVSGDWAAVGMPADRNTSSTAAAVQAGAVVIFQRIAGQWSQRVRLPGLPGLGHFGSCIALDDRILVAGYPMDSPVVFERDENDQWQQTAVLPGPGNALAVAAGRIFAGNRQGSQAGGPATGSVAVYVKQAGAWTQETILFPDTGSHGDEFGHSVAASGGTLVVGAPKHGQTGAAYVFQYSPGLWQLRQKLTAEAFESAGSRFGWSVALQGAALAVGQPWGGGNGSGAVYVYQETLAGWQQTQRLLPAPLTQDSRFGWSVAIRDPLVLVGEPFGLSLLSGSQGLVHAFRRAGSSWYEAAVLRNSAGHIATGDRFGTAVAMAGHQALTGAPHALHPSGSRSGAATAHTVQGLPQLSFGVHGADVGPGLVIDFGGAVTGTGNTRSVTITNISYAPLTGLTAVLEGAHASEVAFAAPAGIPFLDAGATTTLDITFTPSARGMRTAILRILSADLESGLPAATALEVTGYDSAVAPRVASEPASQIVAIDDGVRFDVAAVGTGVLGYQWRKNGRTLPGATGPALTISPVRSIDAGTYTVEVSNAAGKVISAPAHLSVFKKMLPVDVPVQEGAVLKFKGPSFTSPIPLKIEWQLNGAPVPNSPGQSLALNFGPATSGLDGAVFILEVSGASGGRMKAAYFFIRIVPPSEVLPVAIGPWYVAGQVHGRLLASPTANPGAVRFTATGLPKGVTLSPETGAFSGQPTVAGPYVIRCRVWNEGGPGPELAIPIIVLPLASGSQGTFSGLIGTRNGDLGVQMAATGLLTAQVRYFPRTYRRMGYVTKGQGGTYLFNALLEESVDNHLLTKTTHTLRLVLQPGSRRIVGDVEVETRPISASGSKFSHYDHVPLEAYRNPWLNSGLASPQAGVYNTRLSGGIPANPAAPAPEGDGYAIVRLTPAGTLQWSGRMADGVSATGSTALLETGRIPLRINLPGNLDAFVQGWLALPQEEPLEDASLTGAVLWHAGYIIRPRLYPGGFLIEDLAVHGDRYVPPVRGALPSGFQIASPNATVTFSGAGLADVFSGLETSSTLPPSGTPLLPKVPASIPPASLSLHSLTVNPATGLFSGRFRVRTAGKGIQSDYQRDVSFQGLLVSGLGGGTGWFLNPQAPGNQSQVLSGKVELAPFSIGALPDQ